MYKVVEIKIELVWSNKFVHQPEIAALERHVPKRCAYSHPAHALGSIMTSLRMHVRCLGSCAQCRETACGHSRRVMTRVSMADCAAYLKVGVLDRLASGTPASCQFTICLSRAVSQTHELAPHAHPPTH